MSRADGVIRVTLELTHEQAAGLLRLAEKSTYEMAASVLYGHASKELRGEQVSTINGGLARLEHALYDAGARSFPWVETGQP